MDEAATSQALLEVKGLKKHFPFKQGIFSRNAGVVRAVDGVDFTIQPGETFGIVGESGCGKSTTGQLILKLMEPTAGEIRFQGQNLTNVTGKQIRQVRRDMQMVFQDPYASLNPRLTVRNIVAESLKVHGLAKSDLDDQVEELLNVVGLGSHHLLRYPHEFSGGQRQRIGIARALALKPKLIICDEPVSALDVSIQAQILNLLKKLQKDFQLTYIFIAHGLPAVKHVSDRIGVMYLGKMVELASQEALFQHPHHPYTEALLSAIPVPDPTKRKERIVLQGELPNPADPPNGCHFHTRCPYAKAICREEEPVFKQIEKGHYTACHFPL
ncbi:ABC transporter ATP-binding protein [Desmospora activa]|uniref:Peptide/nickel transport system ATP-binding protein n=1 Tax=Desmospora activa DSM 45169 TaxID=1121389 RepID=A0A2T4ZAY4_9BACL|nr:dipeptide ABC transporter ATP-binding protein [Desmospora activa]PTM59053.1 peptide/nickel transport system ATP-binding protein [Desmospora activa DSM 45169]